MVFVTGGTGLVGARLIFDLVREGKKVKALVRSDESIKKFTEILTCYTHDSSDILNHITWIRGDITDKEVVFSAIKKEDEVYHCAGYVSFKNKEKPLIDEINIEGTAHVVNACLLNKAKKLCHVSSIGALGTGLNGDPTTENSPWTTGNKSAYSISKYSSEMEVWRGMAEGLNAVIVNPAVILGPGNWKTGSPQLFTQINKGMRFYTLGSTSYVDVRDVARAMILLMQSNITEERFILASETLTHKALFFKIAHALGKKPPQRYASPALTKTGWVLSKAVSLVTRKTPLITKQTHRLAHHKSAHNGQKVKEYIDFNYTPIDETIAFTAECFKKRAI